MTSFAIGQRIAHEVRDSVAHQETHVLGASVGVHLSPRERMLDLDRNRNLDAFELERASPDQLAIIRDEVARKGNELEQERNNNMGMLAFGLLTTGVLTLANPLTLLVASPVVIGGIVAEGNKRSQLEKGMSELGGVVNRLDAMLLARR